MSSSSKEEDQWGSHDYARVHRITQPPAIALVDLAHSISPLDHPAARVLDVGCGTGVMTTEIVRRFPITPVLATDLSEGMLAKLQALKLGLRVETMQLDAMHMSPVESREEVFTHVLTTATVQFCPEPVKVLREAYRLLSHPKKRLQEQANGEGVPRCVFGVGSWNKIGVEKMFAAVYAELGIPDQFIPALPPGQYPDTEAGVKALMEFIGFKDVRTQQVMLDDGVKLEDAMEHHWEFANPGYVRMRMPAVEHFGLEKCKSVAESLLREGARGEGRLGFGSEEIRL